ncbi:MAG: GNAT family N-acetyltransferase [Anaerolineae bacterium]|nr:GNAT family N-acetyltransferase [Anaerolineae bacterium]
MNIRRATADDAPKLARVHVDSWQVAYRGIVPDSHLERFTYQRREEAFRHALTANLEETYLIEDGDQAVGILTIGASRDTDLDASRTGEIWGIYITPTYWRQGVGTLLVYEAERILRSRHYKDVVLWVLADNKDARRFYEKMGFAVDGMSKLVELGQPLTAIRYKKSLIAASDLSTR